MLKAIGRKQMLALGGGERMKRQQIRRGWYVVADVLQNTIG